MLQVNLEDLLDQRLTHLSRNVSTNHFDGTLDRLDNEHEGVLRRLGK